MKRVISVLLIVSMVFSLAACGSSSKDAPTSSAGTESAEPAPESSVSEDDLIDDEGWEQLEAMGNVETENGIFYTKVTLPAEIVGEDVTQESLDAEAGKDTYTSAKLNDDGSVTYKMTKKQHKAMMDGFVNMIEEELQNLVDSSDNAFTRIEHNKDYTLFDAYLSTNEIGFSEGFMVIGFLYYSYIYNAFTGVEVQNVEVNFYDPNGELIDSMSSADFEE